MGDITDLHICFFRDCRAVWRLEEAAYHDACDTWRCPRCGRCFCDLPPDAKWALDAEGASSWGWNPFRNSPRRKRRSGPAQEWLRDFWIRNYPEIPFDEFCGRVARGEIRVPPVPAEYYR